MRGRWPLVVLLASGLVFLASLYLRWRTLQNAPGNFEGWGAAPSYAAALIAIALVVATAIAIVRPSYLAGLPLGGLGVSLGYFAAAAALQLTEFSIPLGTYPGPGGWSAYGPLHWSWSYGVYVGGASGGTAALSALVLRGRELWRRRTTTESVPIALAVGLLASFLLPWQKPVGDISVIGLVSPTAAAAAGGLLVGAGRLSRAEPLLRLLAAVAVAVLTGATAGAIALELHYVYGAWIGIGCAVALVALEASRAGPRLRMHERPHGWMVLRAGAAVLLLVGLFLPWQDYGIPHGHSFAAAGWETIPGTAAGALAMLLLAAPVVPFLAGYALETALGIALLVATLGIEIAWTDIPTDHLGSGAYLGFVAAGLLLLTELGHRRWPCLDRRRAVRRAVPVIASLACAGAAVVPAWQGVLPTSWLLEADAVRNWFAVAVLLLALHLLRLWIARIGSASAPQMGLVLAPLLILPLPVLELLREREVGIVWGGVILVGLCLLLAALGWIEQRGGVEGFRLPDVLRLDRLPEVES